MQYVYVYCITTDRKLWIDKKYLDLYPHLYKPVYHNGKLLIAET